MNIAPVPASVVRLLGAFAVAWLLALPPGSARAADPVFPIASRLGLVPPPGLRPATTFPGFEDEQNKVYIRLVTLPANAYAEIEKTMTDEALKKQGMAVDKREALKLGGNSAFLAIVRQDTPAGRIRKWLLIAAIDNLTALVSLEMPVPAPAGYTDDVVRAALISLAARSAIPADEQLALVPFKLSDVGGLRLVRVVPGVAVQFTDGPKDGLEATDQPQMVIAASAGGPPDARDRPQFARDAMSGLPPFKEFRIINSEPMRIGGQPGHEVRAQGKDAQTGAEIEIVQWIRFGTGAYVRIVGFAPKDRWPDLFTRFRAVRDGLEPR